jgi:hypothetical protein
MMRRSVLLGFGIALVIWGAVISLQSFSITGNIIFENLDNHEGSYIGIFFLLAGVSLIFLEHLLESPPSSKRMAKARREAEQMLRSGGVKDYSELRRLAIRLGYEVREDGIHSKVYNGEHFITTIPRGHHGESRTGTYRSILKSLYDSSRDSERSAA